MFAMSCLSLVYVLLLLLPYIGKNRAKVPRGILAQTNIRVRRGGHRER